jgi:hypothetical protein
LVSVQARLSTYGADGVDEDRIVLQRDGAPLAVMERQRLCAAIHGRLRVFIGKGYAEVFSYYGNW